MFKKTVQSGVIFRPHFKTHQSIEIGRWFRQAGTDRITVSSLRMAGYFAGDGWDDITVAFPVNLREIDLIRSLSEQIKLGLVVEDPAVVETLRKELKVEVNIWIKLDTGYHRTGLELEDHVTITEIIRLSNSADTLRFQGFLTHAGHTYRAGSTQAVMDIFKESALIMQRAREMVSPHASRCLLSWGDTPSCSLLEDFDCMNEIRPGNFVFYDLMQWLQGSCSFNEIAGILVCPVVAKHPRRREVIIYGGAVHLSKEFLVKDQEPIYGRVVELAGSAWSHPVEGARLVNLSQEHGIIRAPSEWISGVQPGDLLGIVPVHSCLTANLSGDYLTTEGTALSHFKSI